MAEDRSKAALLQFLSWSGEKGYLPSNTAVARKIVVTKVFSDLSPEDEADVIKLDLDSAMARFENRNRGKYGADSLRTYHSRLRNSIRDFSRYVQNPLAYQPKRSGVAVPKAKPKAAPVTARGLAPKDEYVPLPQANSVAFGSVILPIPLRSDLIVQVAGLPFDLTKSEAQKIANIILAHAHPDA